MSINKFTTSNKSTLVAVSNADGETPVYLYADPSTHGLVVSATVSASITGSPLPIAGATTALGVAIVDSSGNQISSFGGGTQYVEGVTTTPATGTVALGRYQATPATITDGKLSAPLLDSSSKLIVVTSGTTSVSGTVTANLGTLNGAATSANQTNGNQQTKITDGTNISNVLKSDGSAAGQNSQMIGSAYQSQTFSITSVTAGTSYDVAGYSWVSIYIATQYTGSTPTITWQGSNDNTNWVGFSLLQPQSTLSSGSLSTTASNILFAGPINFRYVRLNFTGTYSSGTAAGTIFFSTLPRQIVNINGQVAINGTPAVSQSGTWTVQPGNTANTTAWKVDASSVAVPITDNSGSLTVDSPVGTPVFVRLSDGASAISTLPVSLPAETPVLANALSTTVVTVTGSAGKLGSYFIWNPNAVVAYVQVFDISGSVTLGTSTPKWSIAIPPTSSANLSGLKINFANAIKVAATTTATGSTAPSTALDANFGYF